MAILHPLILVLLKHNIKFRAERIPGKNKLCDLLSHTQDTQDAVKRYGSTSTPYCTTFLPENFPLIWGKFSSPQCNRQINFKIFDNGIFLVDFCHTVIGQHNLSLITSNHVALFVAPLSERQLSHITIHTYLSAVSYIFRLREWNDPTSGFTVTKTLQGVQKLSPGESIIPLPITRPLLHRLIQAIPHCTACHYYQLLFKTLFLFTYFACPRAGEIVVSNDPSRVNQMSQIAVFERAGRKVYEINLNSFKHSTTQGLRD